MYLSANLIREWYCWWNRGFRVLSLILSDLSSLGNCNYPWEGIFTRLWPGVTCRLWCSVTPPSPCSADFIVVTAGQRVITATLREQIPRKYEKLQPSIVNPSYAKLEDYADFLIRGETLLIGLGSAQLVVQTCDTTKSVETISSGVNIENYMTCQIPINFFWFSSFRCHQIFRPVDQDMLDVSFKFEVDTSVHIYNRISAQ